MARKGRARRFKEARELKEGFDDQGPGLLVLLAFIVSRM